MFSRELQDISIAGIASDSREVKKDFLFVALTGPQEDGHRYIRDAVRKGAAAVVLEDKRFTPPQGAIVVPSSREALDLLADNFFGFPYRRVKCVGITGTNGKTTTSYLVRSIVKTHGQACGVIGTIGFSAAGKNRPLRNTTPGVIELHRLIKMMADAGASYVVLEVSSHALAQERLGRIVFETAIFTNLTRDHLDYHKTMADYFAAKRRLFTRYVDGRSKLIINTDDTFGRRLRRFLRGPVLTYGFSPGADIRGGGYRLSAQGSCFVIKTHKGEFEVTTSLVGRHNLYNILAATGFGVSQGFGLPVIKKGIEALEAVRGRLERLDTQRGFSVFIDYAHTDDALKNVLESLRLIPHNGRIITVFGCGGDRDIGKRPKMGRVATRLSDYCIITSDNPRWENPGVIIRQIVAGAEGKGFEVEGDRARAIRKALRMAAVGDFVLIAGKGHETQQIIKDKASPFDDKAVVLKILKGMA